MTAAALDLFRAPDPLDYPPDEAADDTAEALDAEHLADLDDDQLRAYVREHLDDDEAWPHLLAPLVAGRVYRAVGAFLADLPREQARQRRILDDRRYRHWQRATAQPLHSRLTARRHQADVARRAAHEEHQSERNRERRKLAAQLALAIQRHRLAAIEAGFEPEAHDRDLWNVLAVLHAEFGGERLSLDEAIGRGFWAARDGDV